MGSGTSNKKRFLFRGLHTAAAAGLVPTALLGVTGCSTIPDAHILYYQAKTEVGVRVIRSVLCDKNNLPLIANTVSPSVTHMADSTVKKSLHLSGLSGIFNDSDIKVGFFEDGRLKAINTTETGNGEAIVKAATTLVSVMSVLAPNKSIPAFPAECKLVKDVGGGKPLSLTYQGVIDPIKTGPQNIPPDTASAVYADQLKHAIGEICAVAKDPRKPAQPVQYASSKGDALISARQPALLQIKVGTSTQSGECSTNLWQGRIPVAQMGTDYQLPVPRAPAFAKQIFSAEFAESGALLQVQYATTSGAAGAFGAAGSLAAIAQPKLTSAKAAEVKAEADLIAQQQRLLQCQADPASCK